MNGNCFRGHGLHAWCIRHDFCNTKKIDAAECLFSFYLYLTLSNSNVTGSVFGRGQYIIRCTENSHVQIIYLIFCKTKGCFHWRILVTFCTQMQRKSEDASFRLAWFWTLAGSKEQKEFFSWKRKPQSWGEVI